MLVTTVSPGGSALACSAVSKENDRASSEACGRQKLGRLRPGIPVVQFLNQLLGRIEKLFQAEGAVTVGIGRWIQ